MTILYDGHGAVITETVHELDSKFYPGDYEERPSPWQRCYFCVCGEDLGFDEEGGRYSNAQEEFEKHLEEVSGHSEEGGDEVE